MTLTQTTGTDGSDAGLKTFERLESKVRGYCRSFPTVFTRAEGALLFDEAGREYIDLLSGAGSLNYGHNDPALRRALIQYLESDGLAHGLDMATDAKRRFLETFEQVILKPREYDYRLQFTGPTGTNAVEAALKIARKVTRRTGVVSFTHGFHGVSLGSLACTGNRHFRGGAGVPLAGNTFMPYDGYFGPDVNTLDYFEKFLTDRSSGLDTPAAVIVETVQGEGGVNVARASWLRGLQRICRNHGILLIVDDIQVGCGRTGPFFSFEEAGITPDLVTLSKSLSGFGLPMSILLIRPDRDVWKPGEHNGTFRGNNLAFATATEALNRYWRTPDLTRAVQAKGERVRRRLEAIAERHGDAGLTVRGRGLIQGLACDEPALGGRISRAAFERGLIIETSGANDEVVKCLPPLTIDESTLDAALDILDAAVAEALEDTADVPKKTVGAK